jgi:Ca-activated chloride channel family protein
MNSLRSKHGELRNPGIPTNFGSCTALALMLLLIDMAYALQDPQTASQGKSTFSVQSQLVQIYFTVTDGNRLVPHLDPAGFRASEDGNPIEFDRIDNQSAPLQIAVLFDLSESMRGSLHQIREAAITFIEALQPEDRVNLILFNSDIRSIPQITADRRPILEAIRQTNTQGGTKLYEALLYSMKLLNGKEGRKAIVCFSDGEDTSRYSSLKTVLNGAAHYGFPIYTIAAGSALSTRGLKTVLRQISNLNSGKALVVEDPRRLKEAFASVATELRSSYVLYYYTRAPFDGKWHSLTVRTADPRYEVHARHGFYARSLSSIAGEVPQKPPNGRLVVRTAGASAEKAAREAVTEAKIIENVPQLDDVGQAVVEPAHARTSTEVRPASSKEAVFKVESRFVEVPVLLESASGKDLPLLTEKDFRIYENDSPREIAYFMRGAQNVDFAQLRDTAVKHVRSTAAETVLSGQNRDDLVLARTCIVLDDTASESGAFLRSKQAIEKLIRAYNHPVRPFSLHLTSGSYAEVSLDESIESMVTRLRNASLHADRELTTNDGVMTVYEAYVIEAGDPQAARLAELRLASSLFLSYRNELGEVYGEQPADPSSLRSSVQNTAKTLIAGNFAQASRTVDGLRKVVSALSEIRAGYPKSILFFSSGFLEGRLSSRGDLSHLLEEVLVSAKKNGIRIYTLGAGGLETEEFLGIGASSSFLARNPILSVILASHASGWRLEREATLARMARETGGRFISNENDLVGAAGSVLRATGQLYYLGFLSREAANSRYHRIRVSTSLGNRAKVNTRAGYFNDARLETVEENAVSSESTETILNRTIQARREGDLDLLAQNLAMLSARMPNHPGIWLELGSIELRRNNAQAAVQALQKAFVLAPENREVNLWLSRALVANGEPEAAAETLEAAVRNLPNDMQVLLQLGRTYEADSRPREAYQSYRKILDFTLTPPAEVFYVLARTANSLDRPLELQLFLKDYLACGGDPGKIEPFLSLYPTARK